MKLRGTNFQSLTEFDLDISGLTVIVGPSNKGKSAVFRALRGLFRNELPAEYIRTTADGLELIATVDGKVVVARRSTKGSTQYQIDGKEFKKLAKTVPPELKAFGMNEVEVGEFTIDPIFSRQNGKQFLIDPEGYTPMELNTILGAFASTEKLEAGKKTANLEITHKNSEAKTLAEETNAAEVRKAQLGVIVKDADFVERGLRQLEPEVQALELKKHWVVEAKARQEHLWPLQAALSKLAVPGTGEIERLALARLYAIQATNSFRVSHFCKRVQESVDAAALDWKEIARNANTVQALQDLIDARAKRVVPPIEPVTDAITAANQGFALAKTLADGIILLAQCQTWLRDKMSLGQQLLKVDTDTAAALALIQETQSRIQDSQKVTCPSCGHLFDPSHICEAGNARTA
jgi:energy-coupling factor transporter ATP-binding protein EcfA2